MSGDQSNLCEGCDKKQERRVGNLTRSGRGSLAERLSKDRRGTLGVEKRRSEKGERKKEGSRSAGVEHEFQSALCRTCAHKRLCRGTLASACSIGEAEPVGARSSRLN